MTEFEQRLEVFCNEVLRRNRRVYDANDTLKVQYTQGKVYTKVFLSTPCSAPNCGEVIAFVTADGKILRPLSWSAPDKRWNYGDLFADDCGLGALGRLGRVCY